jgi:hypothetical protein
MDEKLDSLLKAVGEVQETLKAKPTSVLENILRVLEKLVIPAMLGLLAWLGSQGAAKISESQLRLAESAAEDRKVEFRRGMQAKYIEIFYKDLNSGDAKSQSNAIRLMRVVDSDLSQSLLELVAVTPGVSPAVVAQATEVKKEILAIAPLRGFTIGIYYYKDDPTVGKTLLAIKSRLKSAGFLGTIQEYPNDDAFFERVYAPKALEIRFEGDTENEASRTLLSIMKNANANENWTLLKVGSKTPNFISIFVPRGGSQESRTK